MSFETEKPGRVHTEKLRETDGRHWNWPFWFSPTDGWPPNGGGRPFSHSAPSFRGIKRPFPFSIATIPGQVPVSCVVESAPVGRHGYNCRLVGKNGRRNSMSCLRHPMSFLFLFDLSSTSETLAHASCFFFLNFLLYFAHPPSGFRTREGTDPVAARRHKVRAF